MDISLVMNAVNDYGQIQIAQSPVDFLYTEVWSPIDTYGNLKNVIDRNLGLTNGEKNIVLAAYMNYGKADRPGEFNTASVLLTDAVIFASGGAHIELGDTGMLGKEYFPNDNLSMSQDLETKLKDYYHFLVAYQNILRDQIKPIDREIVLNNLQASSFPKKESIWYFAKKKEGIEILHLINLLNNKSLLWRDDYGVYDDPETIENLKIKYYTNIEVEEIFLASPDFEHGSSLGLSFDYGNDQQGRFVEFSLLFLKYWDMIYFVEKTS